MAKISKRDYLANEKRKLYVKAVTCKEYELWSLLSGYEVHSRGYKLGYKVFKRNPELIRKETLSEYEDFDREFTFYDKGKGKSESFISNARKRETNKIIRNDISYKDIDNEDYENFSYGSSYKKTKSSWY